MQTGSALLVTVITMLRVLPMALFGAFVGAAADILQGRIVLLLSTLALLATSVTLALLAHTGHLAIWHLAVASLISGTIWSTDMPLRRLMIGRVVGADRIGEAMIFDVGSNNASRMAGPAIGGAVLVAFGIEGCLRSARSCISSPSWPPPESATAIRPLPMVRVRCSRMSSVRSPSSGARGGWSACS